MIKNAPRSLPICPKWQDIFLTIATEDHQAAMALALAQTYNPDATTLPPIQSEGRFTF